VTARPVAVVRSRMAYQHLRIRRDGAAEVLLLDRPSVRNALNDAVVAEMSHWAAGIRERHDVRAIVLAGEGNVFCAGADVNWMARTIEFTEEENLRDAAALSRLFNALDTLPIPMIGRIQGAALGGGAGLAAVCDIVVAEESAVFGFTEVKLGIVPAVISPFVLAKIGRSAARELFITGSRFPAARAKEIGLVHAVVPAGQLDGAVDGYLRQVLTSGPDAVATAKQLIADVWPRSPAAAEAITSRAIAARRVSAEGQEGLRAFLEKRAPRWHQAPERAVRAGEPEQR
jgi:methylglutaconyl-CoA hydratase